jgi:phosphinothricin acetyltransferase
LDITSITIQGFRNVYGGVTSPNKGSEHLHKSFGFEKIGVFKNSGNKFGVWADVTFFGKTISDYDKNPDKPKSITELDPDEIEDIFAKYVELIKYPLDLEDMSQPEDSSDTSLQ